MRITDIKSYPVWIAGRNLPVVKVETDAGIYGWANQVSAPVNRLCWARCGITASS